MNVIEFTGKNDANKKKFRRTEEILNDITDINDTELVFITTTFLENCKAELKKAFHIQNKLSTYIEHVQSLLNINYKKKHTCTDAIIFVLENENKELHKDEIHEKIRTLNLTNPLVKKDSLSVILSHLHRQNRIYHGKKRGYWKAKKCTD